MTRSGTVNMAAEDGDDPPGVLQSLTQPRHHLRRFEIERVGPHRNIKRRMVRENRDRLGGLGIDQVDQASGPLGAKVALVAARIQGIDRDQPYRIVLDRIVDKVGIRREISACRKGRAQIRPVVLIAGKDIDRRTRLREDGDSLGVFVLPPVMNDIAGVDDHIGRRIERVDVRNRAFEIALFSDRRRVYPARYGYRRFAR